MRTVGPLPGCAMAPNGVKWARPSGSHCTDTVNHSGPVADFSLTNRTQGPMLYLILIAFWDSWAGIPFSVVYGSILEALGWPKAGFWGPWAKFGLHFGSLLRVLRLPGMLLGAPFAPRAAWVDFGLILGFKLEPKGSQNPFQNESKNRWNSEHGFQWNLEGKRYPKWTPKGFPNQHKIH